MRPTVRDDSSPRNHGCQRQSIILLKLRLPILQAHRPLFEFSQGQMLILQRNDLRLHAAAPAIAIQLEITGGERTRNARIVRLRWIFGA